MTGVAISASALGPGSFALTDGNQPTTQLNYDFSGGTGTNVSDTSGNGNDGELVDFVNTSAGAGAFGTSEGWVTGGGLSFLDDTQRSFVETPLAGEQPAKTASPSRFTTSHGVAAGWTPAIGSNQNPFEASNTVFAGINDAGTMLHFRGPGQLDGQHGPATVALPAPRSMTRCTTWRCGTTKTRMMSSYSWTAFRWVSAIWPTPTST